MWYKAEYSNIPLEVDKTSSSNYVYLRKDIVEERKENDGTIDIIYKCMEQRIPKNDWELYEKILSHDVELTEVQDALIELSGLIVEG